MIKRLLSTHADNARQILFIATLLWWLPATQIHAQKELLHDINTASIQNYMPYEFLRPASGKIFFVRNNELWAKTSTSAPVLLKKFRMVSEPVINGGMAYFAADDGEHGMELWKSNGTISGTAMVKDIVPGTTGSQPQEITVATSVNIYFTAATPTHGRELWRTTGSAAGTHLVLDIMKGKGSSNPRELTAMNSVLYFTANNGSNGYELWTSAGVAERTTMVKDIATGDRVSSNPAQLTNVNGILYFRANESVSGTELWKSNGTKDGTLLLKDIRPGTGSSDIENLINVNGLLFFTAHDGVHGDELWKSDGSSQGTALVKDLNPGAAGSNTPSMWRYPMSNFTNVNGVLFFTAGRSYDDEFIVRSDGTEAGTYIVTEANPVGGNRLQPNFVYLNGSVFFLNHELGLYRLDSRGSIHFVMPLDSPEDYYEFFTVSMVKYDGYLYITSYSSEKWSLLKVSSSGVAEVVHETITPTADISVERFVRAGNYLYFAAYQQYPGDFQYHLWRTDGTTAGTTMIETIGYYRPEIIAVGDQVFYTAGNQLKVVSGSSNVPQVIISSQNNIHNVTNVNGIIYCNDDVGNIWKTDGTTGGTIQMRSLYAVVAIANVNGKAFFLNENAYGGLELWRTNTTGLLLVKTLRSGPGTQPVKQLTASIGGMLYFVGNDGIHGNELWRSDGTALGTVMVADFNTTDPLLWGRENDIESLFVHDNTLYVSAQGNEGWKYYSVNGKNSPIVRISIPRVTYAFAYNNSLYLMAWTTDTHQAQELWSYELPGRVLSRLHLTGFGEISHVEMNGRLYFSAEYERQPFEISSCGVFPLPVGGQAYPLAALNDDLVFTSDNGPSGNEPFIYRNIASISKMCETLTATNEQSVFTPFPNPYTEDFTMKVSGAADEKVQVSVYNDYGMPVENFEDIATNTEYSNIGAAWPRGVYVVKVRNRDGISVHRVLKK